MHLTGQMGIQQTEPGQWMPNVEEQVLLNCHDCSL